MNACQGSSISIPKVVRLSSAEIRIGWQVVTDFNPKSGSIKFPEIIKSAMKLTIFQSQKWFD